MCIVVGRAGCALCAEWILHRIVGAAQGDSITESSIAYGRWLSFTVHRRCVLAMQRR